MGMSLSCPLVKEPESYNNPDYYEDSVQFIIGVELHEINLKFCHCMVRQRMRSRDETVKLRGFIMDWEATAKKLWKRYPDWTSNDLLNLLHLFELFDTNGKKLLRFKDF
ncbi:uncharacterized protein si:ch211-122l24.6 [Hoplias malabaricus]|uniref:uncharacterized protein si:ch211-122l24.6 n=1 Tax=Hoplias malabaricus TaxID=27720 RepID=UPI00346260FE